MSNHTTTLVRQLQAVLDLVIWISLEELGQQRELDPRLLKDGGRGDPRPPTGLPSAVCCRGWN